MSDDRYRVLRCGCRRDKWSKRLEPCAKHAPPPAAPPPHVHRWNFLNRCSDPACPAIRCAQLRELTSSSSRKQWARCERAAEGPRYCARHAHLAAGYASPPVADSA